MLQIIGTKKCKDTAKVLRACKERSIPFQFVDLSQRDLSEGEWKALFAALPAQELLDTDSVYYRKNGYSFREFDSIEELKEHPQLLKTPILRNKGKVSVGYSIDLIIAWGNT